MLALCLVGVACTNSKLVLRPLYNSIDNRMEDRFLEYTSFNSDQTDEIRDLIDHWHVWHRRTQLDGYALLLEDVVAHINSGNEVSESDIDLWGETIRDYTSTLGSCNPFYNSAKNIASLSDEQIIDIRERRRIRSEERRAEREARQADLDEETAEDMDGELADSADGRVKQIRRYLGFIGFRFKRDQIADLTKTMNSTIRPETSFRAMRDELDKEFFALLDQRANPDWEAVLVEYLDRRRQTMASRWDTARVHNRGVWEAYALRTANSLDNEQKQAASSYLTGLANTLKALAKDAPSFQKRGASEYRCLGQKIS